MTDISMFSKEQLVKELERREKEELERQKIDVQNRSKLLLKHIDVLLALVPRHDTINCSDDNRISAYVDNGCPRCKRCFLIQAKKEGYVDNIVIDNIQLKQYLFGD